MKIEDALKELNKRFSYRRDPLRWFDNWKVIYDESEPKWYGDCEDYSLTLMWMLSDRSFVKFLWNILIMKHLIWFVKTPDGDGHAVVRIDGVYYDNIQKKESTKEVLKSKGYKFIFPMIPPIVFIRLALSYTVGRIINR